MTMKNDEPWRFRFDHACIYEINQTGESINDFLQRMSLEGASGKMDLLYDLAWFLTASYRAEQDVQITPALFRARMPLGDLGQVAEMVGSILAEVFPDAAKQAPKAGK